MDGQLLVRVRTIRQISGEKVRPQMRPGTISKEMRRRVPAWPSRPGSAVPPLLRTIVYNRESELRWCGEPSPRPASKT